MTRKMPRKSRKPRRGKTVHPRAKRCDRLSQRQWDEYAKSAIALAYSKRGTGA